MIIDNLDVRRPDSVLRRFKANAPLVVDADAVLPGPLPLWACSTISASFCCVEQALSLCFGRQLWRRADALICRRCLSLCFGRQLWRRADALICRRCLMGLPVKTGEGRHPLTRCELRRLRIPIAQNDALSSLDIRLTSRINHDLVGWTASIPTL
jgi:ribosomal protein L40E